MGRKRAEEYIGRYQSYEEGRNAVIRRMWIDSGIGGRYRNCRLSELKPYESQVEAYKAASEFCEKFLADETNGEGLLLAGNCGSGKTMLAAAIAGEIFERGKIDEFRIGFACMLGVDQWKERGDMVRFVNSIELLERLRCSFDRVEDGSARSILESYERIPLLILDDLGAERPSEWASERLYELINHRYMELLPMIITTNCTADELRSRLGERSFDRIKSICRYTPLTAAESLRA